MSAAPSIAIVGGGGVGRALGTNLLVRNRSVCFGSRDPAKLQQALAADPQLAGVAVLPVAEAVAKSEVVIVAVPGWRDAAGAAQLADSLGPSVAGKVVVDATNPLTAFPELEVLWDGTSGGELLAAALPASHVYKAFNTIGTSVLGAPDGVGVPVTMMFAGDATPEPRATAAGVIRDAGFEPTYVGPIRYARNLEALAELWIHLGVPPAGFTQETFGQFFSFQLARKA